MDAAPARFVAARNAAQTTTLAPIANIEASVKRRNFLNIDMRQRSRPTRFDACRGVSHN
jgi:hypothetical protein